MLLDVVAEAGLDRAKAEAVLNGDEGMEAINEAGELSRRHLVDCAPFFIINGQITVAGAQQADTFLEAFRRTGGSD
jgi:predicted DsbA family dithiol-disulfide isomerase